MSVTVPSHLDLWILWLALAVLAAAFWAGSVMGWCHTEIARLERGELPRDFPWWVRPMTWQLHR